MKEKYTTKVSLEEAKQNQDLSDWEKVKAMTDEEALQNALDDPENQPIFSVPSSKLPPIERVQKH